MSRFNPITSPWRISTVCLITVTMCGCAGTATRGLVNPPPITAAARAQGAGATYPDPIYQKWIERYLESNEDRKVRLTYGVAGSERGLELLRNRKVDYAGTDWPQEQGTTMLQFPTVAGAVVIIYRIDGLKTDLRLTPETLGRIFQGDIKRWNHPQLLRDNPEANLPARDIIVAHRSDGSGTTMVLCEFAKPYNTAWQSGCDFTVKWPASSLSIEHSGPLADTVFGTNDSIGYVEYTYALTNKLPHALMRNSSGQFIRADSDSIAAAIPDFLPTTNAPDLARSILNTKAPSAYPISALTWILLPQEGTDRARRALKPFFLWTMSPEAQAYVELLGYVPLTSPLQAWERNEVNRIP